MIRVHDLHKSYATRFGTKTVFEGISFDLAPGERLGILGQNGAGKSTLVRLVSGSEKPTSGTIERGMSVSWPLAFGGAFQPQLTGLDNVRFITTIYGQDFARNLAFVEDFAELGPYLREPVRTYSSGMRARLAFAISMIIEFDCFLIDEVGAVGDARFHDRCNHELFELRRDRAMIIISHDAGYVREHCNRWAVLHAGKLLQFDDFDEAYESYKTLIGARGGEEPAQVVLTNRVRMIESSQHAALADERFRALVQQGDWARDRGDWTVAEGHYAAALSLYPYQRSYWVQHGHVCKEQERFAAAECSYRTAAALGEPLADIAEHAAFVIGRQDDPDNVVALQSDSPARAWQQPPALPDCQLFARLLLSREIDDAAALRDFMREHANCDSLVASMVASSTFTPQTWSADNDGRGHSLHLMLSFAGDSLPQPARERLANELETGDDMVAAMFAAGVFSEWPQSRAALAHRYSSAAKVEAREAYALDD